MARIWDERFETPGYEETWSDGETVSAGCSLTDDYDTASLSPTPGASWQVHCLRAICDTMDDDCRVGHTLGSGLPISYWRIEFMVDSSAVTAYNESNFLVCWTAAWNLLFCAGIYHDGAAQKLQFRHLVDADARILDTLAVDTYYRMEIKWDLTNDLWEYKLNGVSRGSGALTSALLPQIFWIGAQSGIATVNIDNFAVDNANWIGAEGSIVPYAMTSYRRWRE